MLAQPGDRLHRPGRGRAVRHRRRGALRRHGPLRQAADPPRLVRHGRCRRWCSTTSARARCCWPIPSAVENPFFHDGAGLGAAAAGRAWPPCATVIASQALITGGLLGHQAGDPARLPAAPAHPAHLACATPGRSTCRSSTGACSSASSSRSSCSARASNLAPAYGIAVTIDMLITTTMTFFVDPLRLEVPAGRCASLRDRLLLRRRLHLLRRQPAQADRRRLVPAADRRRACSR